MGRAWVALASLVCLALHIRVYYPYIADDALISLRYADRLLAGHGLTWTEGPRVEGYSNLGWILAVSGLGALGVDLVFAARALGVLLMASVPIMLVFGPWTSGRPALRAAAFACLLWCGTASVAVWAQGALETPLVAASLAACLLVSFRLVDAGTSRFKAWLAPGALLGVMSLARPDGFLFAIIVGGWSCVIGRFSRDALRRTLAILVIPVGVVAVQLAFRVAYYGEWVPNTARVKVVGTSTYMLNGLAYVGKGFLALAPFSFLCIVALALLMRDPQRRAKGILLALIGGVWIAYVIAIGGDAPRSFPAWRHLLPFIVVMAVSGLLVLDRLFSPGTERRAPRHVGRIALACIPAFGLYVYLQFTNVGSRNAKDHMWTPWWGKALGETLQRGFRDQQPLLAVIAAGAVPYWSRLPSLDLLGLNDYHIARSKPEGFGSTIAVGHELGDPAYMLERQPDIVLWGTPGGSLDPWGPLYKRLAEMPEYTEAYQLCGLNLDAMRRSRIFLNRNSPRIGIRRDDSSVCIPAYLLNYETNLDAEDRFYVGLPFGVATYVPRIELEEGYWEVEIPTEVGLRLVTPDSTTIPEARVEAGRFVLVPQSGTYGVLLYNVSAEYGQVYELCLRRRSTDELN